MKSAVPVLRLTEQEYLETERLSDVRREYLGGLVYAMAAASATHKLIGANLFSRLHAHLRDKPCQIFLSDMKVKIEATNTFYYPDVVVAFDPSDNAEYFRTKPVLIIEVASPATAATDRREKLLAYEKIPSLLEYVCVAQDEINVLVYRKAENVHWWEETLVPDDVVELESVNLSVRLKDIYEGVPALTART
ncbi:MAG TPA: Uma2 family endonuclease [Blastocatellia bacterium]|nr:Uma2 family endonuclease [Blastocatellia bacterium]